jgi:PAS domain S-box-containing protein
LQHEVLVAHLLDRAEQVAQLGSFDWNPVTGALHWSDEHFRLWGHAPGSLTPDYATFRASIHPDDVDALEARLQHALQTGGIYEFTHRVRWPDGTELEVLARGDVTRDASGRAVRMLGTVLDITRRRAAEARLQMHEFVLNTITDPKAREAIVESTQVNFHHLTRILEAI